MHCWRAWAKRKREIRNLKMFGDQKIDSFFVRAVSSLGCRLIGRYYILSIHKVDFKSCARWIGEVGEGGLETTRRQDLNATPTLRQCHLGSTPQFFDLKETL